MDRNAVIVGGLPEATQHDVDQYGKELPITRVVVGKFEFIDLSQPHPGSLEFIRSNNPQPAPHPQCARHVSGLDQLLIICDPLPISGVRWVRPVDDSVMEQLSKIKRIAVKIHYDF